MKKIIIILIILLLIPSALAKQYHMKLLAVKDLETGIEGSEADLYLEIIPGSGRIFLDTFPLTRFDTQISTRFAKEIACNFLDVNCDNLDFIYTIRSDSAIVGGPSASAAISVLTVAALKQSPINESVTLTGVINSGGVISPIGGLKSKIEVGSKIGLKKILIPKGQRFATEDTESELINATSSEKINKSKNTTTIDLVEFGKTKNIEVVEVADLEEALLHITNIKFKEDLNLEISPTYIETMKKLALDLCDRSKTFQEKIPDPVPFFVKDTFNDAYNLTQKANAAYLNEEYYATASYCFGANAKYNYIVLKLQNLSKNDVDELAKELTIEISRLKNELENKEIKTITDLETYMVVDERLTEAMDFINSAKTALTPDMALNNLAFATERFYSAVSWYAFFDHRGKNFNLNEEILKTSCQTKLAEAEERIQYVAAIFSQPLLRVQQEFANAFTDFQQKNYKLCLFKASKAKAEVDIVLSTLGASESNIDSILNTKLEVALKNIIKQTQKDVFPILSYSYYEYAISLKESDPYSALLFSEYALELSNLDLYFEQKKHVYLYRFDRTSFLFLLIGAAIGVISTTIYFNKKFSKRFNKNRKIIKRRH